VALNHVITAAAAQLRCRCLTSYFKLSVQYFRHSL